MAVTFRHQQLSNGLTVLAETDPAAHTSAVGFFVRTGARDEQAPLMGVSHFLEHMMFKGTARRSADDVNREFDEIGANYNAYTSHEATVYYAHVLPEFLDRAVDLLADMLRPALRTSDFDVEKNVILEEIGMYEDRPQWRLQDALMETYFGNHPLGFRVLGTVDTIKAMSAAQMRRYFQQRYGPDNIVVAAAGRLDFEHLVGELQQRCGDWPSVPAHRNGPAPSLQSGEHTLTDPKLNRCYLAAMMPGPSAQDEDRYPAAIITEVLGADDGSRLYWNLVDPGLAEEADLSHLPMDRVGAYLAYASCDPDRRAQVQGILLGTLDEALHGISADEIERARNKLATDLVLHGESPGGRMRSLGSQWQYLNEHVSLEEETARLMAVTASDVQALLDRYRFQPRTTLVLTP